MQHLDLDQKENEWFMKELYPHEEALRSWLLSRYSTVEGIDDIIQVAYMRTVKRRRSKELVAPKAFMYAVARNLCIDSLRRSKVVPFEALDESSNSSICDSSKSVADRMIEKEELEILTSAIQSLPQKCRRIFTLRKVYGMSLKQIACDLNISVKTVEVQISIGIRKCRDYYRKLQKEVNQ